MSNDVMNEEWEVEVSGQIYQAAFGELPEWINEGSLLPEDKVRKGNLRWIEARKVPALVPFFNAKAAGQPLPVPTQTVNAPAKQGNEVAVPPPTVFTNASPSVNVPAKPLAAAVNAAAPVSETGNIEHCIRHADREAGYICDSCGKAFCKACPSSYGGSVKICPDCGAMCRARAELIEKQRSSNVWAEAGSKKFGLDDLFFAIKHPFKYRTSLIIGALMFAFFTFGQGAASIGGIFLLAAAIFCMMLSNMLSFGILANVVTNFTQGKLETDFMPDFDDFSLWGDVVHPFFLSIGVYLSSFTPFILILIVAVYMAFSSMQQQVQVFQEQVKKIPGTELYAPDRTAQQSQEVRDLLEGVKQQNDKRIADQNRLETGTAAGSADSASNEDNEAKIEAIRRKMQQQQLNEATQANEPQFNALASNLLKVAAPMMVLAFMALLWGVIYFPAACAVAGYTRSFFATINPLFGLDTMRRLGGSYVKILLMCFVLLILVSIVNMTLAVILSPLTLPKVGNIPATFVASILMFYMTIVFSCLIGMALYRNSEKLKLSR